MVRFFEAIRNSVGGSLLGRKDGTQQLYEQIIGLGELSRLRVVSEIFYGTNSLLQGAVC
jgi:hypothetical protein